MRDSLNAIGAFSFRCLDSDGELLWQRDVKNIVATVGKNLAFNSFLNGSNYTVIGPFLGLIAAQGFVATAASDTMASHPGWLEAGVTIPPTYSGVRPICSWAAAVNGTIALSVPTNFLIAIGAELQGAFIVFGSNASATPGSTSGTLWSAGVLIGGPALAPAASTLQINYSVSM